ncbi:hypothetical protein J6590_081474 [Homalodisca vitripennis]|nr:hypothetical protein J6590_081474 [Homalodisca vitripennis]
MALELMSKLDGQVVQTLFHGFSPLQPLRCETSWFLFTRHGIHLRLPGKRLLAEFLFGCLDRFGQSPTTRARTLPVHAASSCAASSTPLSSLPVQDRQQLSSAASAACGAGHRWVHYIETSSSTYDARTCFPRDSRWCHLQQAR